MIATGLRGLLRRARFLGLLLTSALPAAGALAAEKGELPIPAATLALMTAKDTTPAAPILMRAYKKNPRSKSGSRTAANAMSF